MKHRFTSIRDQLWEVYSELDSFSLSKIFVDDTARLNQNYFDNFFNINRHPMMKRIQLTELDLVNAFKMDAEFAALRRKTTTELEASAASLKLPVHSRALVGPERTNASYEVESDAERKIWKLNEDEDKMSRHEVYNTDRCLHFTLEWTDVNTGMRFARTFFLTTLANDDYMKDVHLSADSGSHETN